MKFKSKKSPTEKTSQSNISAWGDESGVPDVVGHQLAVEAAEIQKADIAAAFDGCGELDASSNIDMWGESIDLKLHTGVIDFGEPEVVEAELPSAESGFHFSDGEEEEFTLAGPSGAQNSRRTVFSALEILDEDRGTEDEKVQAVEETRTRYVRSFTEHAAIDHRAAGLPEPIPARVAVTSSK